LFLHQATSVVVKSIKVTSIVTSLGTVRNVQVKFGEGVASEVGYEAKRMGAKKVLIVTDENISKNTDGLSDIEGAYLAKQAVLELMKDIDFPSGIEAVGFSKKDIEELSQAAMQVQRLLGVQPKTCKD
ncbi:MAG TPA: iron-containing alcohol dehydrogenase, partial [Desulfurella acetivorans]|nr:iron-containing alcohol dehydrogenase [Desulfurella acetivorans]